MPTRTLITEALPGQPQATGEPGRYMLRIITAGEGSSAHYPAEALQQAAEDRIFAFGTHMHLDHPTAAEERDRPVRSMKDLAGVFLEDAVFTPEEGGALDVPIKVAGPYQPLIADLWEHIGASIHAFVEVDSGPRPGGKPVARKFLPDPRNTVDFVTVAGRGGRVMEVLESATSPAVEATTRERRDQLSTAVKTAYQTDDDHYMWVRDFDETKSLVWFEDQDDRCWQQAYTVADDDLSVALTGDPVEVRPTTTYVPVTAPQESAGQPETTTKKEQKMPEISQARLDELTAAEARAAQLQTERDAAITRAETSESKLIEVEASAARDKAIGEALENVERPDVEKARIRAALEAHDGDITEQVVAEAVKAEDDYLAAIAPGGVRGFGATRTTPTNEAFVPYRDAWGREIKEA